MNYNSIVRGLSLVSGDLRDIQNQTREVITTAQAQECHLHLEAILRQLILATRIGALPSRWHVVYSNAKLASIISASSTETSTA